LYIILYYALYASAVGAHVGESSQGVLLHIQIVQTTNNLSASGHEVRYNTQGARASAVGYAAGGIVLSKRYLLLNYSMEVSVPKVT
jgi:hypothetical protein